MTGVQTCALPIFLTGVVIGPGNITTSAMIGANYGYSLVWLIIPILIMGVTFMLTSYRISMLTGMPILHAIRHYYGKVASGFCGVALYLSCLFFTLGNISGTGAGMNLVFGINWKLGALIMLAVLTVLYFSKGDRKSTRLNSSHTDSSRMPSSA